MNTFNNKALQLYIHIPFCVGKCHYCDFLSFPFDNETCKSYIDGLISEIRSYKGAYRDYLVSTIFIGGGTPSIIEGATIGSIINVLRDTFNISSNAEITIEANPESIAEEDLGYWKNAGINRVSIGLQSGNNLELKTLGRAHNCETFFHNYNIIIKYGFDSINIDLISGIPGQTLESYVNTLKIVTKLNPEHISAYSLIIEENTPFWDKYGNHVESTNFSTDYSITNEELDRHMYGITKSILDEAGYTRYEISNYSKEGYECRHNLGYWNRVNYLGIGLGASSLIESTRYKNIQDLKSYIRICNGKDFSYKDIVSESEHLSPQDKMEEFMFLGLRKIKGISLDDFKDQFDTPIFHVYGHVLDKLEKEKLLRVNGDNIHLTDRGLDISNYVFKEFLI